LSGNNGALSNKSFLAKKEMNVDGNEQGYLFSRLWLNSYLQSLDSWNIKNYEERLNIIYERFLKIWQYPDVIISEIDDSEEMNIFDAENPINKKLEYFIFENTRIEEDIFSKMYVYVIKKLFEKNSQLLVSNQEVFKITRNSSDFRSPQEIINGWYIESNMDSNNKFNSLKRLLTLFEMEDDLFIKYAPQSESASELNRFNIRKKYWQQLLPLINNTVLFSNISPSKEYWLSAGAGIGGLAYTFIILQYGVRIELGITTSTKEKNKIYFKKLFKNKEVIEESFGEPLIWEELPDNKMSRIKIEKQDVSLYNENDWERMNEFLVNNIYKFENALKPHIKNLK